MKTTTTIKALNCVCDRCKHRWLVPSLDTPKRCAKCKSPYWNSAEKPAAGSTAPPVRRNSNGMIYKDPATCYHPASKRVGGKCLVCGSILSSTGPADLEPGSVSNLDKMLID